MHVFQNGNLIKNHMKMYVGVKVHLLVFEVFFTKWKKDFVCRDMCIHLVVRNQTARVCLQSSVWEFFTKLFKQHEFHEHPLSDSHIILKGVYGFLSICFIENWCSDRDTSFTGVNEILPVLSAFLIGFR